MWRGWGGWGHYSFSDAKTGSQMPAFLREIDGSRSLSAAGCTQVKVKLESTPETPTAAETVLVKAALRLCFTLQRTFSFN